MLADWLLSDVQAPLSDFCRLPLLHVGGEASAAGLLKQMYRKLQGRSVLQSTAVTSANLCICKDWHLANQVQDHVVLYLLCMHNMVGRGVEVFGSLSEHLCKTPEVSAVYARIQEIAID